MYLTALCFPNNQKFKGLKWVSFDVVLLFTKVSIEDTVEIIKEKLNDGIYWETIEKSTKLFYGKFR